MITDSDNDRTQYIYNLSRWICFSKNASAFINYERDTLWSGRHRVVVVDSTTENKTGYKHGHRRVRSASRAEDAVQRRFINEGTMSRLAQLATPAEWSLMNKWPSNTAAWQWQTVGHADILHSHTDGPASIHHDFQHRTDVVIATSVSARSVHARAHLPDQSSVVLAACSSSVCFQRLIYSGFLPNIHEQSKTRHHS